MPSQLFYKSPAETKPCYLHVDSPAYVGLFVKLMSRLGPDTPVTLTEMLPAVDDTWLVDARGLRYACEMRLVMRSLADRR
jgi:hypothetical protein